MENRKLDDGGLYGGAERYLRLVEACEGGWGGAVAEDEWVDSGTGNLAWKPEKGRRRTVIERLGTKRVHDLIARNCSLIKTVPAQSLPLVAGKVYRVLTERMDPGDFVDWLMEEFDLTEGQAERIAKDQLIKIRARMRVEDWRDRGVKYVRWLHIGEPDPREYHERTWDGVSGLSDGHPNGLDGFVFRIDDPPVIDEKTGERGYPGQLIQCHCILREVRGKDARRNSPARAPASAMRRRHA